jgi:uncharacterized surface protein with fasciclin (FAS1) repeats
MHVVLARAARFAAALGFCALTVSASFAQETKPTAGAKEAAGKTPEPAKDAAAGKTPEPAGKTPEPAGKAPEAAGKVTDIVEVAKASGKFNTFVKALQAAGLVDTLKGSGPFTVFAPTDEAFAKIPKEELDELLGNPEELKEILNYHVVPGKMMAADMAKAKTAKTVQGDELTIEATAEGVLVDGAKVVQADIPASNGVIHAIDTVLLEEGEGGEGE